MDLGRKIPVGNEEHWANAIKVLTYILISINFSIVLTDFSFCSNVDLCHFFLIYLCPHFVGKTYFQAIQDGDA